MKIFNYFICFLLLIQFLFISCEKNILTWPLGKKAGEFDLCYIKEISGIKQVVLGSIGDHEKKILGPGYDTPVWSPDGSYIAWLHRSEIFVFNVVTETIEDTINDVNGVTWPVWNPNSKSIVFRGADKLNYGTYIYSLEMKTSERLYDEQHHIYFYPDGYHFLHQKEINYKRGSIYLSDLEKTFDELWLDIDRLGRRNISIDGFDPYNKYCLLWMMLMSR
jgi:hypothetical protein